MTQQLMPYQDVQGNKKVDLFTKDETDCKLLGLEPMYMWNYLREHQGHDKRLAETTAPQALDGLPEIRHFHIFIWVSIICQNGVTFANEQKEGKDDGYCLN